MKKLLLTVLALLFSFPAMADDRLKPYTSVNNLTDLAGASVADTDFMLVYDASANNWLKTSLEGFAEVTSILNGVTASAAEINYNDITTLGTGAASKAVVLDASGDYTYPASYTGVVPSGGTQTYQSGSTLTVAGTLAATGSTSFGSGTAITKLLFAFDTVASGGSSKTTTLTGATSSSRCVASAAETATNAVYIRSVVPGTDQVVITTSGDPGASNLDFTVICLN